MSTDATKNGKAARRIAFELHALAQSDRAWLLERLAPGQRAAVEAALAELAELAGAARDAAEPQPPASDAAQRAEATVAAASVEAIHALLEVEPESVVAPLLAYRPWPWVRGFLRRTSRDRRRRLRALADEPARVTPLVREALVDLVARSLRSEADCDADGPSLFESTLEQMEAGAWPK